MLNVGTKAPNGVSVFGSMKVTGGTSTDNVVLHRLYVGNALTVSTGAGVDMIGMDDVSVAATTLIDLGSGSDNLFLEMAAADSAGNLGSASTFGGTFTLKAGEGNDSVSLSNDLSLTTLAQFGGRVVLMGGAGADILGTAAENVFEQGGNTSDFETRNGPVIP